MNRPEDMTTESSSATASIIAEAARRLPPEERLLWLICRADLDATRRRILHETLDCETPDGGIDWTRAVNKGRYHRLLDLLHHHLVACDCLDRVPAPGRKLIDESRAVARTMQARLDQALVRCTTALEEAAVEHVLVKGPTLQTLYPDGVVRAAGDLDFVVHEEDLAVVIDALGVAGFSLETRLPPGLTPAQIMRFCHTFEQLRFLDAEGAEVELHFRLHNYGPPAAREPLWDSVACWSARDSRAGIGLEELFLYLVTHLNLHAFGRILWYYDVAEFYLAWRDLIDWQALEAMAQERKLATSFHQTLSWILQLLWPEVQPHAGLAAMRPGTLRRAGFRHLWRRDEVYRLDSWIRPFDASRYYLLSGDPWWRKAAYLRQVLLPPGAWLAAYLDCEPGPGVLPKYLAGRRRERLNWATITRRDELLGR